MIVSVLFFATLKDRAGVKQVSLEVEDGLKVGDLRKILVQKYPGLSDSIDTALVAINRQFALDQEIIPEGSEAALFPPVSGGFGFPNPSAGNAWSMH